MDPLEAWVDVAAVRRMAEQLMSDSPLPRADASPDAGFGVDFVGYGIAIPIVAPVATPIAVAPVMVEAISPVEPPPLPQPMFRTAEPAIERMEHPVGPPPVVAMVVTPMFSVVERKEEPEPEAEVLPFPVAEAPPVVEPAPVSERRGPLMDRLGRFRDGLVRYTSAQGVFILDREGKPVMDDASFGKLYFLARSLAQAYRPVEGQPGNVHVKINANLILEVIPVDTAFGCLVLGAVVSMPLTAQVVAEIATALKRAATPGDANAAGA